MRQLLLSIMISLMMTLPAMADTQGFHRLTKTELSKVLVDHSITDEAHWADTFLSGGRLSGHQLGINQTGSWSLKQNGDLCVTRIVKKAESDCFQVWRRGDQVEYRQGAIVLTEGVFRPK